jgi:hypothetical protein
MMLGEGGLPTVEGGRGFLPVLGKHGGCLLVVAMDEQECRTCTRRRTSWIGQKILPRITSPSMAHAFLREETIMDDIGGRGRRH